jgi:hypothetical protein
MVRQLQAIKMELPRRMHDPIAKTGAWVERMLKGISTITPSRATPEPVVVRH